MKRLALFCVSLLMVAAFFGSAWAEEPPIKLGVMFISSGPLGGYGING